MTFTLGSLAPAPIELRPDTSRAALASLGEEYGELQQWADAILAATDTLQPASAERARALADQLARLISPLEGDFENTTAALSTNQLDLVLPLWERMAFAHAGLVMLQSRPPLWGRIRPWRLRSSTTWPSNSRLFLTLPKKSRGWFSTS